MKHVEPGPDEGDAAENPLIGELDFQVHVPNVMKVTMVDASALSAYEEWAGASGILLNLGVGFTVAAATTSPYAILAIVATIFWCLFLAASWKASVKRRPLKEATKQVSYRLACRSKIRVADAKPSTEAQEAAFAEVEAEESSKGPP